MKRKTIQSGIALLCLLGGLYIHALAFEEGPNENFRCYGWGDIECHGIKVERKTSGFR